MLCVGLSRDGEDWLELCDWLGYLGMAQAVNDWADVLVCPWRFLFEVAAPRLDDVAASSCGRVAVIERGTHA